MRGTICGSERSRWIRALTKSVFFHIRTYIPTSIESLIDFLRVLYFFSWLVMPF